MLLLNMVGPQGSQLSQSLSSKAVVAMFAKLVIGMFRYLDSHHLKDFWDIIEVDNEWPLFCPAGIISMLEKCVASAVDDRPTFQEIVEILAKV